MINYIEDEILSNSTIPQSEELTLTQFTSELLERTPNSLNDVNNIINDFKQGLDKITEPPKNKTDIIDTFTFRCFKHFKENTTFTGTEIEEITKLLLEKAEELREDIEKSFDYFKLCCEYVDILEPKLGKCEDYERRLELIENIKPNLATYKEIFIRKQAELKEEIQKEIDCSKRRASLVKKLNKINKFIETIKQLSNELEEQTRVLTNYRNSAVL